MAFSIRGGILSELGREFHLSASELGLAVGTAFWGFTLAMVFGGTLCDVLGMGRLLALAFVGHIAGVLLTIFSVGFWSLFVSTLFVGLGNGLVEAASNPLVATLYPQDKTTRLNHFHAWFPGGLVIGGLISYGMTRAGLGWKLQVATMLVPTAAYGLMFLGQEFPETERVASGVSTRRMFAECLRPLFVFMILCMFLTAATENGTNQWMAFLEENAPIPGILVFVWVTGLMTVGRLFAGPVVHRLAPQGMLLLSSVFAMIGLYWMSVSGSYLALAAATCYAIGVCFYWPTMLGFVSERLPRTGALGLALMGGAGMLSTAVFVRLMGRIYDWKLTTAVPAGTTLDALRAAAPGSEAARQWAAAQMAAGSATLRYVALLPMVLIAAFALLIVQQRGKTAVSLEAASAVTKNG